MNQKTKKKSPRDKKTSKQNTKVKDNKIKKLEDEIQEFTERHLRLSADFDNFRKRTVRVKMDLIKNAGESILVNFLPIIDDLERAIISMDKTEDINSVKNGVKLIHKSIINFILKNGVKPIETDGKEFNTDLHEAVTKVPANKKIKKGKIVDCIEKGYFLHDKVIRYSKVVIAE